jgi:ribosome-binding ATPase YchF (GTP1/OBG family)
MGFKCGIVGLPNVGKSLFFNLLTKSQIARSANFPFCTIEPNIAKVPLVDKRLQTLASISNSEKTIFSSLEFVDIAGLIPGANTSELGNEFLSHIAQVDSIVMLLRCFEDENVIHHFDHLDPIRDLEIIKSELKCYDVKVLQGQLKKCKNIEEQKSLKELIYKIENDEVIDHPYLLSSKKMLVVCNGVSDLGVKEYCRTNNLRCMVMSLLQPTEELLDEFVKINFDMLNLITYFTTGPKETRAWTIKSGIGAQEASGKIHSDFIDKFIKAKVISYEKYIKGDRSYQIHGKSYIVQDADIIEFKLRSH